MPKFNSLFALALIAGFFAAPIEVQAQFALDARYEDKDGDMLADVPADKSKLVDPAILVFAYTPVEDPALYAKVWEEFVQHLEKVTGKKVQFFPVQSNAAQIEAMRAGRLHVTAMNSGSTPTAVACAGYRPFTMMAAKDDSYGYQMEIITYPGSGIQKVEDIKGKKMAFTAETSNSGYKAPSALLKSEFKMEPGKDYEPVFSGKHDNSILGVANKDYPAAAIANSVLGRMIARDVVKKDQFVSIYKSQTFPTSSYGVAHSLHPDLQKKVQDAFFSFNWEGTKLAAEFKNSGEAKFVPINFKQHWEVVRKIDEASGVKYTCK